MFVELKRKIAHYIIKKKYFRRYSEAIEFKSVIRDAKKIFVIMPENELDFTDSLEIVKYFHIHKKDVSIFLSEVKHSTLQLSYPLKYVSYLPAQINRLFLPNKMLIARLKDKHYDFVIDLNRQEDTFYSCVANVVNSKIRIGFHKNRSEDYYNLLFESKQRENSSVYKRLLEHLSMF
ncbi:MAG: hypothetical protein FD143_647 [Ignavibacteria bacterium]|nr:MAG: hypothetical protein FD143_647 [Ignavibacteria bacterium]KAF0161477.1 MAG: hypothetical protein FD188_848 [Ignavibacteria bacterium]